MSPTLAAVVQAGPSLPAEGPMVFLARAGFLRDADAVIATTPHGSAFLVGKAVGMLAAQLDEELQSCREPTGGARLLPRWDGKTLWYGGLVCAEFNRASHQTLVLQAFQESGWPSMIDDPIPGRKDIDAVQRRKDVVYDLNQRARYIRFHTRGESFLWLPATERLPSSD